jgi:hypothetical protein
MSEICNEQVIALQLRHYVEQDAFGIRFVVGVDADAEPLPPVAHVLTAVTQRVDYLFAHKYPDQPDFGDRGVRTFTICDPGGLFRRSTYPGFKVFLEQLMEGSRTEARALCELMGSKEE